MSRLLVKHSLMFGVGSEDLKLTQGMVRAHGLSPRLTNILQNFAPNSGLIVFCKKDILQNNFGSLSFSLSQNLAAASLISGQQQFASSLRHFAGRIPPVSPPPS